jgi:hypothetical protein
MPAFIGVKDRGVATARNDAAARKRFWGISAQIIWRKEINAAALPPRALPASLSMA